MMEERKLTKEDIDRVRGIEGFPIAKDEDIIALSRPPYYTACPNPFIEDFIKEHGTPYDEATDDYHCEPFAADVSEGKTDPIYMAHSYHTKVPYKAIMRYILHYTNPGDIVFDGFCGTGMTGVAAQMCGSSDIGFKNQIELDMPSVQWGARNAIINDLSPAATFIADNYNNPINSSEVTIEINRILDECERMYGAMYSTRHVDSKGTPIKTFDDAYAKGVINYVVWSDVFVCPNCSTEIVYWIEAVEKNERAVSASFICPHCGSVLKKSDCSRALVDSYDPIVGSPVTCAKQSPVMINYTYAGKRYEKKPDDDDILRAMNIDCSPVKRQIPFMRLPAGDNTEQPKQSHNFEYVHQFFFPRNLLIIGTLVKLCETSAYKHQMMYVLTSVLVKTASKLHNIGIKDGKINLAGAMPLVLYVPSAVAERNLFELIRGKIKDIAPVFSRSISDFNIVSTGDASNIPAHGNTIDYIFVDPPFGSNINYSELNFMWESWLKVLTAPDKEAIVNKTQKKGVAEYQKLMQLCFEEFYRILKPNRWITIEFHNSQNAVWNAINEALLAAGFIVADVRTLDKQQGTFKQMTTTTSVKQDLIISAYKPKESFVRQFTERAGDPEMAWEFVRQHLQNVPIAPDSTGKIEVVAERQDYLLFDRMVALHIMRGIPVPMDAHTFYAGLRERFIQRDGMFFLADQVNEYDERRQKMELQDQQLSLFVTDEKSAIIWLGTQLGQTRQTYSELQPKFLQDWYRNKFEQMPELLDMLKENFLQDDDGKWYVPNLSDQADLEKLRRKRLLKDFFDIYAKGTGRIKNARTEAIRVGFDECWKERNYSLIVKVGDRLPEKVLQEDPALLMYYDNAANRM